MESIGNQEAIMKGACHSRQNSSSRIGTKVSPQLHRLNRVTSIASAGSMDSQAIGEANSTRRRLASTTKAAMDNKNQGFRSYQENFNDEMDKAKEKQMEFDYHRTLSTEPSEGRNDFLKAIDMNRVISTHRRRATEVVFCGPDYPSRVSTAIQTISSPHPRELASNLYSNTYKQYSTRNNYLETAKSEYDPLSTNKENMWDFNSPVPRTNQSKMPGYKNTMITREGLNSAENPLKVYSCRDLRLDFDNELKLLGSELNSGINKNVTHASPCGQIQFPLSSPLNQPSQRIMTEGMASNFGKFIEISENCNKQSMQYYHDNCRQQMTNRLIESQNSYETGDNIQDLLTINSENEKQIQKLKIQNSLQEKELEFLRVK